MRMPRGPLSRASVLQMPTRANLLVEYEVTPGAAFIPAMKETVTMLPQTPGSYNGSCRRIC